MTLFVLPDPPFVSPRSGERMIKRVVGGVDVLFQWDGLHNLHTFGCSYCQVVQK